MAFLTVQFATICRAGRAFLKYLRVRLAALLDLAFGLRVPEYLSEF